MGISNASVIGLGIGTVFVGLICLILICYITSAVVRLLATKENVETSVATPVAASSVAVTNKGEFAAAIAAAIAEDLGTDVTGIRIKSVKKL